jgi:hypothetical protein
VIVEWIGQELLALRVKNSLLQSEIGTAQNTATIAAAVTDLQLILSTAQDALKKLQP